MAHHTQDDVVADKLTVPHRRDPSGSGDSTVESLIRSEPLLGTPDMSVRQAAQLMTERGRDHVLIPLRDRGFGVLTDALIRERVVAAGADLDTPVTVLTERRATVVAPHVAASDALAVILENDLTALPVVDAAGVVHGVVAPSDFVAVPGGPSVALREQISRARDVPELQERASRVPYLVADLVRREQPAHSVTTMASLVTDAVVRRALELVLAAHPEVDPTHLTWMSLGSNARRETVLSSDIDSAVSFADDVSDAQAQAFRVAFGEVDDLLRGAGMKVDDNGAVASMPLFSRTHARWRRAAQRWLDDPLENKGMILTSLLIDARPIWGDEGLPAVGEVFADLRRHRGTLNLLLAEALATRAKMRSVRDLLTRRGDDFDIKQHAIGPLVNLARWAALSVGSAQLDTRGRLRAASGTDLLPDDHAETLVEVFEVLQRVRLNYQVAQFDRGEVVSDVLDMKRLSPLDRSMVAQAVREIAGAQRRAANRAHYLPLGSSE
ncbi:putative nucleotidyltransferase substrate binding domain-containing protein [Gordonia aichiensis]|uniref:CBS domain-containing protein n=1 Tax=Gordonia aichiensis NBRC 108223 TaxID=1220583 RepID=L7KI26_9ACTN|nr:putative nucleotidyltransferase substrate binding domain-containing protein [Gordonia aichiensis]GAC48146.1 hypothetical protein GOACH_05_00140 [Gordonia aichiensis NBRC 108223]